MQQSGASANFFFVLRIVLFIVLLAWYGFFLAKKIDLTTADIGRHIQNGNIILHNAFSGAGTAALTTNFYSSTNPDYPFLNHHWASGVIFALVHQAWSFYGISLVFILISLATFAIFFRLSERAAGFPLSFSLALFLIPLIAERLEVRPEAFSYLFIAIFFFILQHFQEKNTSWRSLFLLPLFEIIWVNIHVYFFFGLFLIGVFLADEIRKFIMKQNQRESLRPAAYLLAIFFLTALATLFNPATLRGALYPLNIFHNYGYMIVENQSVWFLENLGFSAYNFLIFKIALAALAASFILLLAIRPRACSFINALLAITVSVLALLALRNFTLFGFFALPIIAANLSAVLPHVIRRDIDTFHPGFLFLLGLTIIGVVSLNYSRITRQYDVLGLGLAEGVNQSAQFFLDHDIRGPVFNNYDIGGYLIYHLYPRERVFVDNRPEAYPDSFFQNTYVPVQQNEDAWQQQRNAYHINAIFFSYRDYTPWAQKFLVARIQDPQWAPVFADNYAIIFLARNDMNAAIIKQFEIPKERFSIRPTA